MPMIVVGAGMVAIEPNGMPGGPADMAGASIRFMNHLNTEAVMGQAAEALANAIVVDMTADMTSAPGLFSNRPGVPVSLERALEDFNAFGKTRVSIADLTLDVPARLSEIIAKLRRYGVVLLPRVIRGEALECLRRDFVDLVGNQIALGKQFKVDKDESNVCLRLLREKLVETGQARETVDFFSTAIMSTLAQRYFGHDRFVLNAQIFVHETRPTDVPLSGALHFDVSRMLKFWVYLDAGTRQAGAMRVAAGSNLLLSKIREEFSQRLIPKAEIFNLVDEVRHPAILMEAPAGSIIIFDTDAAHGAGSVAPGNVRRIMRGHTMETQYIERSKQRMAG